MSAVLRLTGPLEATFELQRGQSITIGRSLANEVSVDDLRLSRRHCRIQLTEQGLIAEDLNSANGTFVNANRVRQIALHDGDVLQLGNRDVVLRIEYSSELAPPAEPKPAPREPLQVELDVLQLLLQEGFEVREKINPAGKVPIYRAIKRSLGQEVALKVLPMVGPSSEKKVSRFVQEAKAQARLRHRHIVAIYDVRQCRDLLYIVMELVDGETLLESIRRSGNRLSVRAALSFTYQLARALAHAHQRGIVHRDLKPGNIMITRDGDAKLIDFGLAKNLHELGLGITSDGEALGTVGYMAPEQLRDARSSDTRTDIFGLGACLYHALAGRAPFLARSERELIELLEKGPPLEHLVGVPLSVVSLIVQMTHIDPEKRFPSPTALLRGIEEVVTELTGIQADPKNLELLLGMVAEETDLMQTWRIDTGALKAAVGGGGRGISGAFVEDELVEYLGMLEFNRKSGTLRISSAERQGALRVREGRIVNAESAELESEPAILALLSLRSGAFEFSPGKVAREGNCDVSISSAVLDAMRQRDESETGDL
ncbi:MAG: protein kinase [Myxococcales bacterium]|nr:protein kinase [Planctomycetota bacterium]MCA9661899.1 protein kinase [Myxococcales bacterium]